MYQIVLKAIKIIFHLFHTSTFQGVPINPEGNLRDG